MGLWLDMGFRPSNSANDRRWASGYAMAFVILPPLLASSLAVDTVFAGSTRFQATYAGAVTTTEIDLNEDEEETARVSQGTGQRTLIGPFVFHEIR